MTGGMRIRNIDPRKIKTPEVRITSVFEAEIREMFIDDIEKDGINQPLIIARDGGDLYVIDGKNRLEEALLKGHATVPCVVKDMTLKEMQMRNLVLNRLRGKTKASEEVMVIKDLYEQHGAGIEEIVERTGMKRERVEQLLQISGVELDVWQALDEDRIKVCHAFQISRLVDGSAQLRMLRVILQYPMNCDTLKGAVNEALAMIATSKEESLTETPLGPAPIPAAECAICHEKYPIRELSAPVLCRHCFSILVTSYDAARAEIVIEKEKRSKMVREVVDGGGEAG